MLLMIIRLSEVSLLRLQRPQLAPLPAGADTHHTAEVELTPGPRLPPPRPLVGVAHYHVPVHIQ